MTHKMGDIIMKKLILKILFIILSLVWFFGSFEFDNKAGDLKDSAFRVLKDQTSGKTTVSENARFFCIGFVIMLIILIFVFSVNLIFKKKLTCIISVIAEFTGVLFMTYRFQITANAYGNITYIPAMLTLLVITLMDIKNSKN